MSPALEPAPAQSEQVDKGAGQPINTATLKPARPDAPTRIEQVRRGKRIAQVVVTPQGFRYQYRMAVPELKPLQNGPNRQGDGLSVPRFINLSF